jgi:hypothetical protein
MELIGMWKTAISKPEFLVEVLRIDDQRVTVPLAERAAIVGGEVLVVLF